MSEALICLAVFLVILWLSTPSNSKKVNTAIKLWASMTMVMGFAVGAFL
jgi:hypothetical protein